MSAHHATNSVGDFVMLASFVSCFTAALASPRRAAREIARRARKDPLGK